MLCQFIKIETHEASPNTIESMDCSWSELAYEITAVALCIGNHWLAAGVWEPETLTGRGLDEVGVNLTGNYLKSGEVLLVG